MSQHYGNVPNPNDAHYDRGYGNGTSGVSDFATGNPSASVTSPLSQSLGQHGFGGQFHEDFDAAARPNSAISGTHGADINRSASSASTAVAHGQGVPSRNNTLKKKSSMRRSTGATGSLKRSGSRKSLAAGSIKSVGGGNETEDFNSAFYTPVPTHGSPTDILANRFQSWRQLLKSLIAYFREIQNSYDSRAKAVTKVQSAIGGITHPAVMLSNDGLADATRILEDFHRHSLAEANKSREIENDVISGLSGLRSDLSQKIKEIKSLSGDFKNSVDKEKEATRREVEKLQEALQHADHEDGSATGKNDPYVVRLGVDRAVEKQIDEENYLHRAYLNLEISGRELESIVVGEIQKAYNALAGILKREGDDAYKAVEGLRSGPISMPKDEEWSAFVTSDPHFVAPDVPLRRIEDITYPGRDHPAATEIRAGMLERKSKYLKSYSPGWYVLSPTHLHEFKSADKIYTQPPVMSLSLAEQKLGTHSEVGSSSSKFMLKGRQSGGMHKGHSWVFRAESHETMLAWYQDIQALTEKTGEERVAFLRRHARSVSGNSDRRRSFSSDGLEEDEADQVPYSADAASLSEQNPIEARPQRPQPGGRFPSDLNVNRTRNFDAPQSPSSESSGRETINAAPAVASAVVPVIRTDEPARKYSRDNEDPYRLQGIASHSPGMTPGATNYDENQARYMANPQTRSAQPQDQSFFLPGQQHLSQQPASVYQQAEHIQPAQPKPTSYEPDQSSYSNWVAPAAVGVGAGAAGAAAYNHYNHEDKSDLQRQAATEAALVDDGGVEAAPSANNVPNTTESVPFGAPRDTQSAPVITPISNTATAAPIITPVGDASTGTADNKPVASQVTGHDPNTTYLSYASNTGSGIAGSSDISAPKLDGGLGGLEARGAHETGQIFPKVIRHDTDISVSQLHVPGEFPKKA
ncbi:hypothetical protein Q7P35_002311 [Cladosporium inversicolor]